MTYAMNCSCGDTMSVKAKDRDEAVSKMKETMSENAVRSHMKEKHPNDTMLGVNEVHAMIDKGLKPMQA